MGGSTLRMAHSEPSEPIDLTGVFFLCCGSALTLEAVSSIPCSARDLCSPRLVFPHPHGFA
jgi:hypothetical protein